MDISIIPKLKQRLTQALPGLDTQLKMAPPHRDEFYLSSDNAKNCGVLELLYPIDGELYLVLMKRSEDGHTHSGQVCFPGGRHEPEDATFLDTGLREAEEEVGVAREGVQVLGQMTELYIPPSNNLVYPTLGFMPNRPDFILDPIEVAGIIEVKLTDILDKSIRVSREVSVGKNRTLNAPAFDIQGHTVWGATAMMLIELIEIVEEV